jgi:hypothetical protein
MLAGASMAEEDDFADRLFKPQPEPKRQREE